METEVWVGNFEGNLEKAVKTYSDCVKKVEIETPFSIYTKEKFACYKNDFSGLYLLVISSSNHNENPFNIIMTVHGPVKERTKHIADDFSRKANIELREAPSYLKRVMQASVSSF